MKKGTYFFTGVYGVGKSTLCQKLSQETSIPFFSASDLISQISGETFGSNKSVKNKARNQDILISAVDNKLKSVPTIILAGHFCIFDNKENVEWLPEYVFEQLHIIQIVLLEASIEQVYNNINNRDGKTYSYSSLVSLKTAEHQQARKIAKRLNVPLQIHQMRFNSFDITSVLKFLQEGEI